MRTVSKGGANVLLLTLADQKSKKKKKSKKKGNTQAVPSENPATPVESQATGDAPEEKDAGESDDSDREQGTTSPDKTQPAEESTATLANGIDNLAIETDDAAARFNALVKDRDVLRLEVTQLRKSLEELQSKHATEIEAVRGELADTQAEKENAEEQYQSLLGKVNTIRSQLGERLKADAVGKIYRLVRAILTTATGRPGASKDANRRTGAREVRNTAEIHCAVRRG